MRYQQPEICELLAAEYVLGTLRGRARQRFEGLLHARPDLRRRVREWEVRFSTVMGPAPAVSPPPDVWDALQKRLFPAASQPPRWFERLAFWRGLALGSSVLAGVLAVLLFFAPLGEVPGYVVVIKDPAQQPVWLISTAADMSQFYVKNVRPIEIPPGKRCILWLRPQDSEEVYALDAIPDWGDMTLKVGEDMRPLLPGELLVTLEDVDEELPTQPTGPPMFQGEWLPIKRV